MVSTAILLEENLLQLHLHPDDDTGQSQPADGGGIPLRVLRRRTDEAGAIAAQQFKLRYVASDGPGAVMVLAVYVVGHRAGDGHKLGAGCYRQEPALGTATCRIEARDTPAAQRMRPEAASNDITWSIAVVSIRYPPSFRQESP